MIKQINVLLTERLTDLDLARLPRVWIVLEMRVRVREVAGSYRQQTDMKS